MYERWEPRGPAGRLRHHLSTVIDWGLARQIAGVVAGEGTNGVGSPAALDGLPAAAADSERLVTAYTGLRPPGALPRPESLDRRGWIDANVRSLRPLLEPLGDRLGAELGPLAAPVRAVAGVLVAAEVGALFGYMSRHVLGQYELMLLDSAAPARLLFVAPNLDEAVSSLDADAVREGDLLSLVTAPEQRALLDRAQATMSVLEGYAEHVMDAVGVDVLPSLPQLRAGLERRRSTRSAASRWLARLLGLDLKLRQYRLGKRFSDEVVAAAGIDALNRVWTGPEALPTLPELEDPAT